jgi:hypothetical protein
MFNMVDILLTCLCQAYSTAKKSGIFHRNPTCSRNAFLPASCVQAPQLILKIAPERTDIKKKKGVCLSRSRGRKTHVPIYRIEALPPMSIRR